MAGVQRCVSLGLLVMASAACGERSCPGGCPGSGLAILNLSCGPTDLTSVTLTGPCATTDAGPADPNPAKYVFGATSQALAISSPNPGTCHVVLSFASGFSYSTDVLFTSQTSEGGCCPAYVAPTQPTFSVNNPSQTCTDAGP
jgi:hypothetical protein